MIKTMIFGSLLVLVLMFETKAQNEIDWMTIEGAIQQNSSSEKYLLVDLTADWCGWCKKMDITTFSDEAVATVLNEEFYPVKMDFESTKKFVLDGNEYTAKSFARKAGISGLPTFLVISSDYQSIEMIEGYYKPKPFLKELSSYR